MTEQPDRSDRATMERPASGDAREMATVADVMTEDPVTVEPSLSLKDAVDVLRGAGVSGAPVVRGGQLVGVVSSTDILEFEATHPDVPPQREERVEWGEAVQAASDAEFGSEFPSAFFVDLWADSGGDVWNRVSETDTPEWDRLAEHAIGEVMSRDVVTVSAGDPVSQAARRMLEHRVHRVIVVDDGRPIGLVSAFDLITIVAER